VELAAGTAYSRQAHPASRQLRFQPLGADSDLNLGIFPFSIIIMDELYYREFVFQVSLVARRQMCLTFRETLDYSIEHLLILNPAKPARSALLLAPNGAELYRGTFIVKHIGAGALGREIIRLLLPCFSASSGMGVDLVKCRVLGRV